MFFASLVGLQQIVCWGTLTYAAAVFAPDLARANSITTASVMTAYGVGLLTNAFAAPALTRWVLRRGAFVPACLGLGLLMASCLVLSHATHWSLLLIGFMLAGLSMALTQYDFAFLTVKLYQPSQARRVITMITFYGALASTIMWPAALALSSRLGASGAWIALGAISVVVSLPAVLVAYRQDVISSESKALQGPADSQDSNSKASEVWVLGGLIGFMLIGTSLVANLPLVLAQMQTPSSQTAWILSLFGIGQLFARALDYAAGRWLSVSATVFASGLSIVIALACMAFTHQHTASAAAFVFLLGAGNGLVTILRGVLPQMLFAGAAFASVSGQLASLGAFGRAIMPVVVAQSLEFRGSLLALSLLFTVMALACGLILWRQTRLNID